MDYATDYIENYLDNTLSHNDKIDFENRLKSDESLRGEVAKVAKLYNAFDEVKAQQLMQQFAELEAGLGQSKINFFEPQIYLKWAAGLALIAMLSTWYYLAKPISNQDLFLANYTTYPNVEYPVSRSGGSSKVVWLAYENGDYEQAFEGFEERVEVNALDYASWFYLGICALELNRLVEAENALNTVASSVTGKYSEQARWYLALSYLRADNISMSVQVLIEIRQSNSSYTKKAKELLLELD